MYVLEILFYFFLFYYVCMCGLFGYSCYKERIEEKNKKRNEIINSYKKVELNEYKIIYYNTKKNIEYSEKNKYSNEIEI